MNFSKITDTLYIGTTPRFKDYDLLVSLGIELVINMRFGFPPIQELFVPPLKSLWLPTIDSPLVPLPITALKKGAEVGLEVMSHGGVVLSHCTRGRHRSVAMGTCLLYAQGMKLDEAMKLIKEQRPIADPYIWYIQRRIVRFAREWDKSKKAG